MLIYKFCIQQFPILSPKRRTLELTGAFNLFLLLILPKPDHKINIRNPHIIAFFNKPWRVYKSDVDAAALAHNAAGIGEECFVM